MLTKNSLFASLVALCLLASACPVSKVERADVLGSRVEALINKVSNLDKQYKLGLGELPSGALKNIKHKIKGFNEEQLDLAEKLVSLADKALDDAQKWQAEGKDPNEFFSDFIQKNGAALNDLMKPFGGIDALNQLGLGHRFGGKPLPVDDTAADLEAYTKHIAYKVVSLVDKGIQLEEARLGRQLQSTAVEYVVKKKVEAFRIINSYTEVELNHVLEIVSKIQAYFDDEQALASIEARNKFHSSLEETLNKVSLSENMQPFVQLVRTLMRDAMGPRTGTSTPTPSFAPANDTPAVG